MKLEHRLVHVERYGAALAFIWTLVVIASLAWNISAKNQEIEDTARVYGRITFQRDVLYRQWVSELGGVYAVAGERVAPNPHLSNVKDRDIPGPQDLTLTLVNPAYMTRMVSEMSTLRRDNVVSHITGLRPIRPGNAPDAWEHEALLALERGQEEVSGIQTMNGEDHMRVIRPLYVTESCQKCHPTSEAPLGSVRGGITESVRLAPLRQIAQPFFVGVAVTHGGIWLLVLSFIWAVITRLARSQRDVLMLLHAVEQSPASIIITSTSGVIEYVNPKFCEATGYDESEVIGRNPCILRSGYTPQSEYKNLWDTINAGGTWRGEFHNRRKDGTLFWESAAISPILTQNGKISRFIAVKEEITERKEFEIELLNAKEKAEAASVAKSQFLAVVSHELRTPLNAIIGFSEILTGVITEDFHKLKKTEYAKYILSSAQHLLRVVNDILELSKIEAGKRPIHDRVVDVGALVQSCLQMVRSRAEINQIMLTTENLDAVPGLFIDEGALRQSLLNLLSNAVKFTPPGGQVTVRCAQDDWGTPSIAISDTGIGIAAEDIPRSLEPFGQVESDLNRRYDGTGLGLSVANSLVRLERGTLTIDSTPGQGTTVTLRFGSDRLIRDVAAAMEAAAGSHTGAP